MESVTSAQDTSQSTTKKVYEKPDVQPQGSVDEIARELNQALLADSPANCW